MEQTADGRAPRPAAVRVGRRSRGRRWRERGIELALFLCALVSILTTAGIVLALLSESMSFFGEVSPWDFLTGTEWTPLFEPSRFGVLPLVNGTLLVAAGAAVVALPLGLLTAIYLMAYAPPRARGLLKPALEVLAGIPTVVYGYFAISFVTPLLRDVYPDASFFNAASASIVVGIMILPMVASLSEDAMSAVPRSLQEGGYALGATKFEVSTRIVVPAALSGILASFVLAISRAVGETMAVAIAAGNLPQMTLNPFDTVQTMSAYIVQVSLGDAPFGTVEYKTIFAVGLTLFIMTLILNIVSQLLLARFREEYE